MATDQRASSGGRQRRGAVRCGRRPGSAVPTAAVAALVVAAAVGCVQRRMTIRSNPPGALVYVDDYQIGTTPVSHDFVYYGTRKIRLVKDGYETLTVRQPFPLPWYQVFPLDFVTENLWPGEIRDERVVDLAMQPAGTVSPESIVSRAEQVRLAAGSLPPIAAPVSAVPPAPPPAPRPVPAPPPAVPPLQQYAPAPQYPQPPFVPAPPYVPAPQQLPPPNPGFQAPFRNAPSQGVPSLGAPPVP